MNTMETRCCATPDSRIIDAAAAAIGEGGIVIIPTDTLYAFACDALDRRAIERLCRIKGLNPAKNTLSILCADLSQASAFVRIDNSAYRLLRQYLPGPFTFVLPVAPTLPKAFKERRSVGVRIPSSPIAKALASALEHPLLVTSVPADDNDTEADMQEPALFAERYASDGIALAIDAGAVPLQPSTVVDLTDASAPAVLRQGAGTFQEN